MKYTTHNDTETKAVAAELALSLEGGEVITLSGDLGAGKTTFAQGLAEALGVKEVANSPTFAIMKVYQFKNKNITSLCHIDAYRLEKPEELINIGFDDYQGHPQVITIIEWPEKVPGAITKNAIKVTIGHLGENVREIEIER